MKKILFFLPVLFFAINIFSQPQPLNLPKDAKVQGSIVDMKSKQPQNNELIVFKSRKNGNEYQALSNETGIFTTRLAAGDKYDIFIMGFKDSTSYNVLDIPALGPNSYYKTPFNVNIEFDPPKTFVLDNVEFDFGKATLRPEAYKTLDDLVDYLNRKTNEHIELGGHTDNVGSEPKNKILSLERAKSIVAYLVSKGISNDRLLAKGYGSMEPIEENTTEAGRQKNRRTEVKILE
ncbi:MAG: OmpA family protein [Chitinophagaceae bacterium]|nr:OmpA family protein [Chitinophagaceae bacterium]